jgi:hypothetical protein
MLVLLSFFLAFLLDSHSRLAQFLCYFFDWFAGGPPNDLLIGG